MRLASCNLFERYLLTLVGFQSKGFEKVLKFTVPDASVLEREEEWLKVPVIVECERSTICETSALGQIWVLRVSRGRQGDLRFVTGKFQLTLAGGKKIDGNFSARYVKPSTPLICE